MAVQGSIVMHQRGATTLVTEEPYALIAHVRVCGGAGWATAGSTRKPTPYSVRSSVAPASGRGSPLALGKIRPPTVEEEVEWKQVKELSLDVHFISSSPVEL
jgi:hypothetical protein